MQPAEDASTGESHLTLILVAIGLPIIYVFSLGPAILLLQAIPGLEDAFMIFYWPLIWLHEHTWLGAPLEAYANLWGR